MSYEAINQFPLGLDVRKFYLSAPAGSLTALNNSHVNQGGEVEKRKAFVEVSLPSAYDGIHFGLQPSPDGIYIFGSTIISPATATRDRNANVARIKLPNAENFFIVGDVVVVSGISDTTYNGTHAVTAVTNAGGDQWISYANTGGNESLNTVDTGGSVIRQSAALPAPFIYQQLVYPGAHGGVAGWQDYEALTGVITTLFGDAPFAIGQFPDGNFVYYGKNNTYVWNGTGLGTSTIIGGTLASDSVAGLQLNSSSFSSTGEGLAEAMEGLVEANTNYTDTFTFPLVNDIFSVPSTLNGTPFTVDETVDSAAGTITIEQQTTGIPATAPAQAVGSFEIVQADAGTQATGTLTNTTDTTPANTESVTIGSKVYTFKDTMTAAYDVQRVGASRATTLANLAAAVNASGTAGTNYFAGTLANTTVKCTGLNTTTTTGPTSHWTLAFAAIAGGTAGNSLTLTGSTNLTASAATLLSAVASKINQIVVDSEGTPVNLLTAVIPFTTDIATTASLVVANINANPPSGFTASSDGGTVTILVSDPGAADNGFSVQVQTQGTFIIGTGAFSLTGSGFTFDFCKADGVGLMANVSPYLVTNTTVLTYPLVPSQVLADFCRVVANSINSGTSSHGYSASCLPGSISVYLAKATSTSTDKQAVLDVSVTATSGNTGSVIPVTVTPLQVSLDTNAVAIGVSNKSGPVTATVQGGVSPFVYRWTQQGTNAVGIKVNTPKSAQTTFSGVALNAALRLQLTQYNRLPITQQAAYLQTHPALAAYLQGTTTNQVSYACVVTDALGEVATSDLVYVTLLGQQFTGIQ